MAKDRSEKSKYTSKYTEGFVSPAQYLVEVLCEKICEREKRVLPYKFWNTDEWKKTFVLQVVHANRLLKKYDIQIILSAIRDNKCYFLTSLGANYMLEPLLKKYQKQQERIEQSLDNVESLDIPINSSTNTRKSFANKNKLKELNDE